MEDFKTKLSKHLKLMTALPFLFVGSGFSRRYYKLPNWAELLKQVCHKLKLNKDYSYYVAVTDNDMPKIATEMSHDLNQIWWTEERFKESVRDCESKGYIIGKYSPLKYEICKYIKETSVEIVSQYKEELEIFKNINVGGIITTNWDNHLENLFPDFKAYIGQEELLFFDKIAVGDIFKIHGSIDEPNSLILTQEDYQGFIDKYAYLASKLLTMFVEQPIIFIGYSLGDPNIEAILINIVKCLSNKNVDKLKDRLIFCQWVPGIGVPVFEDSSKVLAGSTISIKILKMDSYMPLYQVLASNKERLPIHILKKVQNMIYDVVKSQEAKGNVFATDDLDKLKDGHDIEVIFGLSLKNKLTELGYKGIKRHHLFEDLLDDKGWNSSSISTEVLPGISKGAKLVPYFKYLRLAGLLDEIGQLKTDDISFENEFIVKVGAVTLESLYYAENYHKKKKLINEQCQSIKDVLEGYPLINHRLMYIPLLDMEKINLDELERFIKGYKNAVTKKHETFLLKLICLYDFLKYKLELE